MTAGKNNGMQTSYTGTLPQKRVVSDRILMADPMEIPLLAALGMDGDSKFKFVNAPGKVYEWLEDSYSPISTTFADTDIDDTTDHTTLSVATGTGSYFQSGDVLVCETDYMWVVSVSSDVLTVARGYDGNTAVTHASTSTVYLRSRSRLEGQAAGDSHYTEPTTGYNYSFIMQKTIEISRSDARIQRYGIPDLENYEIQKKMDELKIDLTRKPYFGYRTAGTAGIAGTGTPRDAGGLDTFISSAHKTACASAALTLKNIEDAVQGIWDDGGRPSLLVCDGWGKRKITSFFSGAIQTMRSDTMGGVTIDRVQTAMGPTLDVLVDRYIPSGTMYILTPDEVGFLTIDEFFYEPLAKTKDTAAYGQIVGEYGFVCALGNHHWKISGYSTSA